MIASVDPYLGRSGVVDPNAAGVLVVRCAVTVGVAAVIVAVVDPRQRAVVAVRRAVVVAVHAVNYRNQYIMILIH